MKVFFVHNRSVALAFVLPGRHISVVLVVPQGLTLVVAPLLSLIDDQVAALAQYGVRALHLSSTLAPAEAADVLDALRPSRVASTILYATPERLQHNLRLGAALDLLHARGKLARIVVDEVRRVT